MNEAVKQYDITIIGGGISGCAIARDVASCGYNVLLLERSKSIGGVWQNNQYPGLRLHGLSAPYRCWSKAPSWQKNSASNLYRPTQSEILDYIHSLVDHDSIHVQTNATLQQCENVSKDTGATSYLLQYQISKGESSQQINATIQSRIVIYATGPVGTLSGTPHLPIDPERVQNGAFAIHSSDLASFRNSHNLQEAKNIYVVGSSKAAIDILYQFSSQSDLVQQIKWIHRGHNFFTSRESMESWMISSNTLVQYIRKYVYHLASWICYIQAFGILSKVSRFVPFFPAIGKPLTKIPFRGGIESRDVLKSVENNFSYDRQILLKENDEGKSIRVNSDGIIEFHSATESYQVQENDVVIFCTGQRHSTNENLNLCGSNDHSFKLHLPSMDTRCNTNGIFTVHSFSQIAPVNAMLIAGLAVAYLDNPHYPTIYKSPKFLQIISGIYRKLNGARDQSAWALSLLYLGGMFYKLQPLVTPSIIGDFGFHYRWQMEWFGKDLDVREQLVPLMLICLLQDGGKL